MIIAVDFDGTLYDGKQVNATLLRQLQQSQRRGDIVILWTCREGQSLRDAVNILLEIGFRPNFVNQNAPNVIRMLGHDTRKIYADVYIDDKAMRIEKRRN